MTEPVKVPLVYYDSDGMRHVIGTAEVDGDQVRGTIDQNSEESRRIASLMAPMSGDYSIGVAADDIQVKAVPYEVAYLPPLQFSGEVPPVERLEKYLDRTREIQRQDYRFRPPHPDLRDPEILKKFKAEREQTPNVD